MSEEFRTKKISQETLGEYLLSIRKQLGFTLEDVAQKIGVFEKFLAALENGKYQQLPPDVYVHGFLKKLADFYKISFVEIMDQYRKERGVSGVNPSSNPSSKNSLLFWLKNFSVTPKFITAAFAAILVLGAVTYIVAQVLSVNSSPSLVILSPENGSAVSGSSFEIKGKTDPGMTVTVNNQNVLVGTDGLFSIVLGVTPGQKDFDLIVTNKFGKQSSQTISVKVDESKVAGEVTAKPTTLLLELNFLKTTTIMVKRDGVDIPEEIVPAGAFKKIVADEEIELTTSDAGSTIAVFNDQKLGPLGKPGQSITIPFSRDAQTLMQNMKNESLINSK